MTLVIGTADPHTDARALTSAAPNMVFRDDLGRPLMPVTLKDIPTASPGAVGQAVTRAMVTVEPTASAPVIRAFVSGWHGTAYVSQFLLGVLEVSGGVAAALMGPDEVLDAVDSWAATGDTGVRVLAGFGVDGEALRRTCGRPWVIRAVAASLKGHQPGCPELVRALLMEFPGDKLEDCRGAMSAAVAVDAELAAEVELLGLAVR